MNQFASLQSVRGLIDFWPDLAELFQGAGWKVEGPRDEANRFGEALFSKGKHRYFAKLVAGSEGRRDRLVGLLSQAILEAQSAASRHRGLAPLAVVAAPRIAEPVVEALRAFANEHAHGVAIGVLDSEGLRSFFGPGLDELNSQRNLSAHKREPAQQSVVQLFSDLNQWMLKALLAPNIERAELMPAAFPRQGYRNVSELAKAAHVSVMSAFRFVRQLDREGFLHESRDRLRLVRIDALLKRWQAANQKPARELNARWILAGAERQLPRAVERLGPRACLGLFSAARAMGLGHVQGVPVHIYVNEFRSDSMKKAGLMKADPGDRVDAVLRLPSVRESVFRGIVDMSGLPVSDVLQIWLDVAAHPARGKEQADVIHRRVIKPMIEHANASVR